MDQTIKAEWIDALYSGKYEKGTGALRRPKADGSGDTYCCLGVLCEIAVREGVIPPPRQPEADDWLSVTEAKSMPYSYGTPETDGSNGFLPTAVQEWAGLSDLDPKATAPLHERARGVHGVVSLTDLNDCGDYTFQYIARFIGEHF